METTGLKDQVIALVAKSKVNPEARYDLEEIARTVNDVFTVAPRPAPVTPSEGQMWVCPPCCEMEHSLHETAFMLGAKESREFIASKFGIYPCASKRLSRALVYSYVYHCQDIQRAAYESEGSLGIDVEWYRYLLGKKIGALTRKEKFYRSERRDGLGFRRPFQTEGFVYLVEYSGIYKIGKAVDVQKRLVSFALLPGPITLVHTFKSTQPRRAEIALHRKYELKRIRGEWFRLSGEDVADICSIKHWEG